MCQRDFPRKTNETLGVYSSKSKQHLNLTYMNHWSRLYLTNSDTDYRNRNSHAADLTVHFGLISEHFLKSYLSFLTFHRIDCVGILKLRNADIELRNGETDIGRKNTRVRLVFRVHIPQPGGQFVSLQVASQPIECCKERLFLIRWILLSLFLLQFICVHVNLMPFKNTYMYLPFTNEKCNS